MLPLSTRHRTYRVCYKILFGRSVLICECLPSQQKLSGASNIAAPDRDERDCPRDGQSQEREARDQTSSPTSPPIMEGTRWRKSPETAREGRPLPLTHPNQGPQEWVGQGRPRRVPTPLKSGGNLADEDEEAALEEAEVSTRGSITRSSPCYARRQRLQFEAHTCQKWSQIERRAEANINLSRRSVSPSELKILGRGLSFVPKPKRIQQERLHSAKS